MCQKINKKIYVYIICTTVNLIISFEGRVGSVLTWGHSRSQQVMKGKPLPFFSCFLFLCTIRNLNFDFMTYRDLAH